MDIKIEVLKTYFSGLTEMLNNLLKQLDSSSKLLSDDDVREIIGSQSNRFFVAKDGDKIIGMLILVIYRKMAFKISWLEDIVVDEKYRGKGIATKLINYAIENAKAEGVSSVNLTSRPERESANRLYGKLGFEKRNTNVYRIKF
jgi:ribosomal protein S18 acetylase RimI-like enzyme